MLTLIITDHQFNPSPLRLSQAEGQVQVVNKSHKAKRIVSDTPGQFDSGTLAPETSTIMAVPTSQCVYQYHEATDQHLKGQLNIGT
jgi:hypothetical protein